MFFIAIVFMHISGQQIEELQQEINEGNIHGQSKKSAIL